MRVVSKVTQVKLCTVCHGTGQKSWDEIDSSSKDRDYITKRKPCNNCDQTGRYVETVTVELGSFKKYGVK